jgi:hypothetical protein
MSPDPARLFFLSHSNHPHHQLLCAYRGGGGPGGMGGPGGPGYPPGGGGAAVRE